MSRSQRRVPIRFGTSGWRGVLGSEITLPRVAAVVRAVARWLEESGLPRSVLVAHDSRPGGERLTATARAELVARGVTVVLAAGAVPTPVAARAVTEGGFGAGLMFTASHNPPAYHGLKVIGPRGSGLEKRATRRLERLAGEALAAAEGPAGRRRAPVRCADLVEDYLSALAGLLDVQAIARARPLVHYDAMHGVGAGVLDRFLRDAGARLVTHRARRDARFAGLGPDPVDGRLATLSRAVRGARGLRLGLATDGDADRYAAVDAGGRILSPTQAVALLVDHLAARGRVSQGVAISVATGSLVERVARAHGLRVERTPIGFKWLSRSLLDGRTDCAGEESGGFVWRAHGVDKDGILAGALLAELVAGRGEPLGARLAALERRHGPSHCGRIALPGSERPRERLAQLLRSPPQRALGVRVLDVDRRDGLRLGLEDGFVMLRASGTEPVVRVYAEGPSAAALGARLRQGARWLGAGPSGNLPD